MEVAGSKEESPGNTVLGPAPPPTSVDMHRNQKLEGSSQYSDQNAFSCVVTMKPLCPGPSQEEQTQLRGKEPPQPQTLGCLVPSCSVPYSTSPSDKILGQRFFSYNKLIKETHGRILCGTNQTLQRARTRRRSFPPTATSVHRHPPDSNDMLNQASGIS